MEKEIKKYIEEEYELIFNKKNHFNKDVYQDLNCELDIMFNEIGLMILYEGRLAKNIDFNGLSVEQIKDVIYRVLIVNEKSPLWLRRNYFINKVLN